MTGPASALAVWALRVAVAVDELGNALLGGSPHETISSRAYKAMLDGNRTACVLCRALDLIQRDHCRKSVDWMDGQTWAHVEAVERSGERRLA